MIIDEQGPWEGVIPGHPATKKNSPILVKGRALVLPTKAYKAYEKLFRKELEAMGDLPHYEGPVQLTAEYWLQDRRGYPDLNGLIQATQDIISDEYSDKDHKKVLKRQWLLADDRLVKSLDGCRIAGIDRDNPRTILRITPLPLTAYDADPQLVKLYKEKTQCGLF
ncbi:MAG: hypothetical protein IJ709_10320 [Selenomonas sp.]|nr:hypothetical protein [Selenomonas sp.]